MAFGAVIQALHRRAGRLQCGLHALGVFDRRATVFASGGQEYRHLQLRGQIHRRTGTQRLRITHPIALPKHGRIAQLRLPSEHQRQVIHADIAGRALVQPRLAYRPHHRRVRTVTGAVDADALAVGDALGDGPARGVGHIVLHRRAPLLRTRLGERAAIVGRTTEVDLQHGIPCCCQHLRLVAVAALIEYAEGATVRQHDHWQIAAITALRQCQESMQRHAVAGLQCKRANRGGQFRVDPFTAAEQMLGRLRAGVEQVEIPGVAARPRLHHHLAAIAGTGGNEHRAAERRLKAAVLTGIGALLIEEPRARCIAGKQRAHRHAGARAEDDRVGIDHAVAQHLAPLAGLRVPADDGIGPGGLLDLQIGQRAIFGEADCGFYPVAQRLVIDQRPLRIGPGAVVKLVDVVRRCAVGEAHFTLMIGSEIGALHG
ncbi:hypothetical protein D3C75_707570 [compost metagenome]